MDVVGSGVIGGERGITSCRFHFDRRAHGIGATQAHIVVIDIRNFLTSVGQCCGIDIRGIVIGLNRKDNGEWLLRNRERLPLRPGNGLGQENCCINQNDHQDIAQSVYCVRGVD